MHHSGVRHNPCPPKLVMRMEFEDGRTEETYWTCDGGGTTVPATNIHGPSRAAIPTCQFHVYETVRL